MGAGTAAQRADASGDVPRAARRCRTARSGSTRPLGLDVDAAIRKAALEIANDYAKQLRRITVQRRLVREAPKPIAAAARVVGASGLRLLQGAAAAQGLEFLAGGTATCGIASRWRSRSKRRRHGLRNAGSGLNPGHGGEAAKSAAASVPKTTESELPVAAHNKRGLQR